MRRLAFAFFLIWVAHCRAQTLHEELQKSGIPQGSFSSSELEQHVNAASTRKGQSVFLVYMRLNAKDEFTGFPEAIRYEPGSGQILRKELAIGHEEICCGSPLSISLTAHYALFEFHLTPSASTIIATDENLHPAEILMGFGTREIGADEVAFVEDMVHFSPAHAERIMLADLRTGASQELYPPKGDALRAAFSEKHSERLPPPDVCAAMNDLCDPDTFDEDVESAPGDMPDRFLLRVRRSASHVTKKDEGPETVLSEEAMYVFERRKEGWFYCGVTITGSASEKAPCSPNLRVEADGNADSRSLVMKVN